MKHFFLIFTIIFILTACGNNATTSAVPTLPLPASPEGNVVSPETDAQPETVAIVNGVPISYETYQRELARFEAGYRALGFETSEDDGYRRQVLDLLVEQELIRQEATAQGIVISDEAVQAEIQLMIDEVGEEYFDSWLTGNFYTREEFFEVIRLELMTRQLRDPLLEQVPVTAPHVHARHILVNSPDEAEEVLARLQAGEDFAALAAAYSIDVTSKENSGDLGWFPRGGLLVPEVEEAAFSLQPGQVSDVVASAWGYHIVQTLEFADSREIELETRQRLKEQALEEWRQQLRDNANIQLLLTF